MTQSLITEKTFHGIDPDGVVQLPAVAGGFAGVIADPAHDDGKRILFHDLVPRLLVALFLGETEPRLNRLAGRADLVARRHPADVNGTLGPPGARKIKETRRRIESHRKWFLAFHVSPDE